MTVVSRMFVAAIVAVVSTHAQAQTEVSSAEQGYPSKPIRVIVPRGAGSVDLVARILGQKLTEALGQQVVVDNRPGAGGNIGAALAARAVPDGYTLLFESMTITLSPSLYATLPYDVVRDFAPVCRVVSAPNILFVPASLGVNSVKELIALAKSKPGGLNYASAGAGTVGHLATELFRFEAGLEAHLTHVPYKGGGPAVTSVISGETQLGFTTPATIANQVRAGRVRALAVAGPNRTASMREVPTFAELGFPGIQASSWFGLFAVSGTPPAIISKLHAQIVRIMQLPETQDRLTADGYEIVTSRSPQEFGIFVKAELAKWRKVIKASGMRVD